MSEMEQAVTRLESHYWALGAKGESVLSGNAEESHAAVLSLYATAIRERDEARALATELGACLEDTLGGWDDYFAQSADGVALSLRVNAALAALREAKWEM